MSSNTIDFANSSRNAAQYPHQPSREPTSISDDLSQRQTSNTMTQNLEVLVEDLASESLKKQITAVHALAKLGEAGEMALAEFLIERMDERNPLEPTAAHGSAYQYLYRGTSAIAAFVSEAFPEGLVCPQSDGAIDYRELQMLLVRREYQAADKLTMQKLCELAGESAIARKWVYFTEVSQFPAIDLQAMDILWSLYSEDKFGWSKQRALWLRLGKDWERLWLQLIWKSPEGTWTRYPDEFTWDLTAPEGHLPLSNQLRGVRTLNALLSHPAWE